MLKNDTLKNGTSRVGLYGSPPPPGKKLKKSNCQSLKELFPALFCSVVLISVGCNSEHVEADEGK